MMHRFYLIPTVTLQANPPVGGWFAHSAPADPTLSFVVVEWWSDPPTQDAWEALPGVLEYHLEELALPAKAAFAQAVGPTKGALPGMTGRQLFSAIRQWFPAWRH